MKCFHCQKKINDPLGYVLISSDGDFVCKLCETPYNKEKDHFLNMIIHDDKKYEDWIHGH